MTNNRVTIKDVYEIVEKTSDGIRTEIRGFREEIKGMEERITFMEYWKANITGKVAVVVGVISIIGSSVWTYVWNKFSKDN